MENISEMLEGPRDFLKEGSQVSNFYYRKIRRGIISNSKYFFSIVLLVYE